MDCRDGTAGRRVAAWEAGFTLVELVIGIVLSTLITGAVVASLIAHGRLVENLSASSTQTEHTRDAMLLLNAEITDLTTGAVSAAKADSVAFRYPLFWGVMCGPENPKDAHKEDHGLMWLGPDFEPKQYDQDGDIKGFAVFEDDVWKYFDVAQWSKVKWKEKEDKARKACLGEEKDDDNTPPKEEYFKFEKMVKDYMQAVEPNDTVPDKGSLFTMYVEVSYSFKTNPDGEGVLLYRGSREGSYPLVGPFASNAAFRYRLADGTEQTAVVANDLPEIRQIQVKLPALKRKQGPWASSDSLEVTPWISLQNSF